MASLYGKYIKEREGFGIVEDARGFATYGIFGDECYIRDIFVLPQFRDLGVGSEYADKIANIAKEKGCKCLTGTVYPNMNGSTESLMAIVKYGFTLVASDNQKIILKKEL